MFNENDVVELTKDLPEYHLKAGIKGTILMVLSASPPAHEVEFMDDEGETLAVETVYGQPFHLVWSSESNHENQVA